MGQLARMTHWTWNIGLRWTILKHHYFPTSTFIEIVCCSTQSHINTLRSIIFILCLMMTFKIISPRYSGEGRTQLPLPKSKYFQLNISEIHLQLKFVLQFTLVQYTSRRSKWDWNKSTIYPSKTHSISSGTPFKGFLSYTKPMDHSKSDKIWSSSMGRE